LLFTKDVIVACSDQPDVSVFEERGMDSDDEDDVTPSQQVLLA